MGIDIYLRWKGMTPADEQKQITGFDTTAGDVGYLRESYHGGPYATRFFLQEAFNDDAFRELHEQAFEAAPEGDKPEYYGPKIPAATLRARLPATVFLTLARHALIYSAPADESIGGVIEAMAGAPDQHDSDPEAFLKSPVFANAMSKVFGDIARMRKGDLEFTLASRLGDKQIAVVAKRIETRELPDYALAFVDFTRLAELKEKETGEPVNIYASY